MKLLTTSVLVLATFSVIFVSVVEVAGDDGDGTDAATIFKNVDKDKSGFISEKELKVAVDPKVCNTTLCATIHAGVGPIFDKLDKNNDNKVSVTELEKEWNKTEH